MKVNLSASFINVPLTGVATAVSTAFHCVDRFEHVGTDINKSSRYLNPILTSLLLEVQNRWKNWQQRLSGGPLLEIANCSINWSLKNTRINSILSVSDFLILLWLMLGDFTLANARGFC